MKEYKVTKEKEALLTCLPTHDWDFGVNVAFGKCYDGNGVEVGYIVVEDEVTTQEVSE